MRIPSLFPATALLLGACLAQYQGNENSPYYPVPVGSRLILNEELTIPAEQVGVYIQDGRVQAYPQIRNYYPHCKFELYTLRDVERKVAVDEFTVTKTVQLYPGSADSGALLQARMRARMRGGGASLLTYVTRLDLRSPKQPDVYRMTCGQWGYPPYARHVTIFEIRRALGAVFTLEIPGR